MDDVNRSVPIGDLSLQSPARMATRGVQRVNYAELNMSNSLGFSGSGQNFSSDGSDVVPSESSVFRSPTASTRGRKRRPVHEELMNLSIPKRGRPRGTGGVSRIARGGARRGMFGDTVSELEDTGLIGAVKSGRNIDTVLDEWIEAYDRHPDDALLKLQQFFISCCGCKGQLTPQMVQNMEYSDIIRRMTEDFDEDSGEYPLVQTGTQWRRFRANLHQLIYALVDKCKSSIIFDQRMMDSVIQLLTGLADSQVRAFRHTATFIAMKMSSALVDVTIEIVSVKDKNSRQIDAERARLKGNVGSNEKLEMLIQKKNEIEERTDDVRQMLQYIFKSVFVHRYRDVLPDTRSICITELGNWMLVYPEHFLEDSYLKYIGWSLHDKVSDVRLKCISAMLPLYDKQDMYGKLELFTNKFKERLVSMVLDKDNEVAMKTCQLLTSIYRVFPSILSLKDCIPIYELVYCNHRGLAVAAGEFLNTKVFQSALKSRMAGGQKTTSSESKALINDLIQFYIEGECHDHASYLVDALIDTNPIVKDWQAMVELLLSDEVKETMELQLIDVLCCSVRQASTGESPVGRTVVKRGAPSTKESRVMIEDKTRLTEVLIPAVPQLIQKFIADREKTALLVSLPLYFQLDMYMAARLEHHLAELMRVLEMVVERQTEEQILSSVAEVIVYLTSNQAVAQHTETYRLKMVDGVALQLRHTVSRLQSEEQWDDEDEAALVSAFKKIAAFSGQQHYWANEAKPKIVALTPHKLVMDVKKWELWDLVLNLLTNMDAKASRDVVDKAILFLDHQLLWDLHRLVRDQENNKIEAVKRLKKRKDQFVHIVQEIITESASGVELGFLCLTDCLIMFNSHLTENGQSHMEPLVMNLYTTDLVSKLQTFVTDNVFSDAGVDQTMEQTHQLELMHKKRLILTQYCKMIIHGVFDIEDAAPVLKYYYSYFTDYGDLLRQLLYKCRDLDFIATAKAVSRALIQGYESIRFSQRVETVNPLSDAFNELRDLSKKFAVAFGSDNIKNRDAVAIVHRDGIQYALKGHDASGTKGENRKGQNAPPNLSFLEVVIEFSPKLLRQDKMAVLNYLERYVGNANSKDDVWHPYLIYRNSLVEKQPDDLSSVRSFSTIATSRGGAMRGRPRGSRSMGRATPTPSEMSQ